MRLALCAISCKNGVSFRAILNSTRGCAVKKEIRTVVHDSDLGIEAYRFRGAMRFPNHFHEYYVIGFLESGDVSMYCNGVRYVLQPGDMLLLNPGDSHTCDQAYGEAMDYRCLNIQPERMKQVASEMFARDTSPRFSDPVAYHSDLVSSLRELHAAISKAVERFRKEEIFLLFLAQLVEEHAKESPAESEEESGAEVREACRYIEERYAERIGLNDLSEVTGLSKWNLIRAFTKEKGISPYSYLETVRIAATQKMLAEGVPPVDVSLRAGFSDQSHFTNYFKKFIGLTPKQYAKIFTGSERP